MGLYYFITILVLFFYLLGRKIGKNKEINKQLKSINKLKKEYEKINTNDINIIFNKLQNGKF